MVPAREILNIFRTIVLEAVPELRRMAHPVKGRVVAVRNTGGVMGSPDRHYTVDVQVLGPDGSDDAGLPVLPGVELSPFWAGPGRGVFALPPVGALVRVGFYEGDPSRPFVDAVLGDGFEAPATVDGRLTLLAGSVRVEIDQGTGDVEIHTASGTIRLTAATVEVDGDLRVTGSIL